MLNVTINPHLCKTPGLNVLYKKNFFLDFKKKKKNKKMLNKINGKEVEKCPCLIQPKT